jgi:hypothetical protein
LRAGHGPAHAGSFHAVGAKAFAGTLGQATADLLALGQEGGVVELVRTIGEIGGGGARLRRALWGGGVVLGGQGLSRLRDQGHLPTLQGQQGCLHPAHPGGVPRTKDGFAHRPELRLGMGEVQHAGEVAAG